MANMASAPGAGGPPASSNASGLAPGAVVGARFQVERAVSEDALGTIVLARDQKTQKPIALRVLAPGLVATPAASETLRNEVKTAAAITHRSVVGTYGMGVEPNGTVFIACEWVDGQSLSAVVAKKKREDGELSLRSVYTVVAHVAKALTLAAEKGAVHGAVRPGIVWLAKNGRVRLAELGIARAILRTAGPAALGPSEQPFLAPEVRSGRAADARSDVFGLGGLLYAMLTGRSAADEFVPPSHAHSEASADIDAVLLKCLSADPAQRYASPEEVRLALAPLCGLDASAEAGASGVDVEVAIDVASAEASSPNIVAPASKSGPGIPRPPPPASKSGSIPRPPAAPKPPQAAPQISNALSAPAPIVGARISLEDDFRASAPPSAPVLSAEVDLGALLGQITENDAPRWMVIKDKLDHGPFSGRELVQMIAKGEVLGEHGLLNMDTGERRNVREYPEFVEFVEQYRIKKAAQDEKVAIASADKVEKASNTAKYMIALALLVGTALIVTVVMITRQGEQVRELRDAELAELYERGEVPIEGTAGILPDPPRRSGSHRSGGSHGGGGGGGGGGGAGSYEEAMNRVVMMGDITQAGGETRLSPSQVAGVMNGRINTLFSCVSQELRGGSSLGRVRIDIAIAGSGEVLGASVRAGTPEFQRCVQQRVSQIRFPTFTAQRMGASYTFDASQ